MDKVFLASDCITHEPGTGHQVANNTQKTFVIGGRIAVSIGGYATANAEIEAIVRALATEDVNAVNKAVIEASIRINERMAPEAARQGITPPDVFSIVAGLYPDGSPVAYANAPSIDQYLTLGRGQFIGLGTVTERVHQIATEQSKRYPAFLPIPCDQWAVRTMISAAEEFPQSIGFPIDLTMLQSGQMPRTLRIQNAQHQATPAWAIRS